MSSQTAPAPVASDTRQRTAPAQKQPQPVRWNRLVFHSLASAYMLASYFSLGKAMANVPVTKEMYGGDLRFLTIIAFIVTTATMVLSALRDLAPDEMLIYVLKRMFALIALPIEITVSAIYWPLVICAPHLMLPPKAVEGAATNALGMDPSAALLWIPLWIDLGLHFVPAVTLIIDFFYLEVKYVPPTSTRIVMILGLFCGIGYAAWVEYTAMINGVFPYPFLDLMEPEERLYTYMGGATFAVVVFWILNALHK